MSPKEQWSGIGVYTDLRGIYAKVLAAGAGGVLALPNVFN